MKLHWHRDVKTHRVNPHKHLKPVRNENGYLQFLINKQIAIEKEIERQLNASTLRN